MFFTNGIDSFDCRMRNAIYKLRQRVPMHPNSIINNYFIVQKGYNLLCMAHYNMLDIDGNTYIGRSFLNLVLSLLLCIGITFAVLMTFRGITDLVTYKLLS